MREARVHLRLMLPSFPWTRALEEGRVQIPGVTYECAPFIEDARDRFDAFAAGGYDVGEDSVRRFVIERLKGGPPTALPVFFDREHLQRNVFVRADSPLTHPRDLPGRRVGSRLSFQSGTFAGVLMMLEQGYGIPLREISWRVGTPPDFLLDRLRLHFARGPATDRENLELLMRSDLDAVEPLEALTMWMRRAFVGLTISLAAAACGAPPQPAGSGPGSQSAGASPQSSSPRRITAAIRGIPTSMVETRTLFSVTNIPGLESIDELVHSGLTQSDDQGIRQPRLAEALPTLEKGLWTVFPDGRMETTWRIRSGARWHDDAPVTSADLLFAVTVEQDKELALPRPAPYELIESVEAPAPHTVTVRWKEPFIEADGVLLG